VVFKDSAAGFKESEVVNASDKSSSLDTKNISVCKGGPWAVFGALAIFARRGIAALAGRFRDANSGGARSFEMCCL
jgi:hypothetical protein